MKAFPHQPLHNYVAIVMDRPEEITESGIHVQTNQKVLDTGTVVAVGEGLLNGEGKLIPVHGINVGDRVKISSARGASVEWEDQTVAFVHNNAVVCILNKNPKTLN